MHKYSIGTKVYHITSDKYGVIVDLVLDEDSPDELRYIVNHSGYDWSVPERFLKGHKRD